MIMSSPQTPWFSARYTPVISAQSFVSPTATVIGPVEIDSNVMVSPGACLRADEGGKFYIGKMVNVQDNVIMHGLKNKCIEINGQNYSIYISEKVSCAHGCIIHGPTFVGERTFVGFNSIVHSSSIGSNCFIGHGARVIGVEIPDGMYVPHGAVVDTQAAVRGLIEVPADLEDFNAEVVEVNVELAKGYIKASINHNYMREYESLV